jgi:hypothetical protein
MIQINKKLLFIICIIGVLILFGYILQEDSEIRNDRIKATIHGSEGENCDTYKAKIFSYSDQCVRECDNPARAKEAKNAASDVCADFCQSKECPISTYIPALSCTVDGCWNSSGGGCGEVWPWWNFCYYFSDDWNCYCKEVTIPDG